MLRPFDPPLALIRVGPFFLASSATTTSIVVHAHSDNCKNIIYSADGASYQSQGALPSMMASAQQRHTPRPNAPYRSPSIGSAASSQHPPHLPPPNGAYPTPTGMMYPPGPQGPVLPPISTFQDLGRQPSAAANVSSVRYHPGDTSITSPRQRAAKLASVHNSGRRSPKRKAANSSNVTSTNTSDYEDEDNGELPSKGLVAPWEVLRGLADVAAERAAQVCIPLHP